MKLKTILLDISPNDERFLAHVARVSTGNVFERYWVRSVLSCDNDSARKDYSTISNIYRSRHMSVFEFASVVFQIECPIYVARQLMRYRCGSYIERSLRYNNPLPIENADSQAEVHYNELLETYGAMLEHGGKKEDARALLPVCAPTVYLCKYNLRELLHIFDERLTQRAQSETRSIVQSMFDQTHTYFPTVLDLWKEENERNVN